VLCARIIWLWNQHVNKNGIIIIIITTTTTTTTIITTTTSTILNPHTNCSGNYSTVYPVCGRHKQPHNRHQIRAKTLKLAQVSGIFTRCSDNRQIYMLHMKAPSFKTGNLLTRSFWLGLGFYFIDINTIPGVGADRLRNAEETGSGNWYKNTCITETIKV